MAVEGTLVRRGSRASSERGDTSERAAEIALMATTGRHLLVDDGRFEVWRPAVQSP